MLIVPRKQIECGVYGDLVIIYPKPYSIYLRGTIAPCAEQSARAIPSPQEIFPELPCLVGYEGHMSSSQNSLKGINKRTIMGVSKGDTRSSDCSSHESTAFKPVRLARTQAPGLLPSVSQP